MNEDVKRSAELIERLLANPDLRRRFRSDPASVLVEAGLGELAVGLGDGAEALVALETRESRSSLAGVMIAAAAEGVDLVQAAVHAAPALARDVQDAVQGIGAPAHPHHAPTSAPAPVAAGEPSSASAASSLTAPGQTPRLQEPAAAPAAAPPPPSAAPVGESPAPPPVSASAAASAAHAAPPDPTPAAPPHPAARSAPGARLDLQPVVQAAADAPPPSGIVYPGDGASPQALAAWMGARAQAAGLPPELPVMAALTESGLHNLSYGDRDSVGFFQMRTGIWDAGAYAGYPDHPELQIQWFIDHALAVRNANPALAQSPDSWGEWVADVEQPAAEYRGRYQLQLGTAQELLQSATLPAGAGASAEAATTGTGATSAAVTEAATTTPPPPPPPPGEGALKLAMSLLSGSSAAGAPPRDSGAMVALAYARQGIALPPDAVAQFDLGIPVARGSLHPGDVIFLAGSDGQIGQEGIYAGGGRFVTVSPRDGTLELVSLSDPAFAHAFVGARRFTLEALENPGHYARPLPTIQPVSAGSAGSGAAAPTGSGSSPAPGDSPGPTGSPAAPARPGSAIRPAAAAPDAPAPDPSPGSHGAASNPDPGTSRSAASAPAPSRSAPGATVSPSGSRSS